MSKIKKNNQLPLMDGLSKDELNELKLKMEIEKLHFETADKKRSWLYKNSGILIPSLIALGTISTGILSGYFSDATIKLENQKHDLQDSINIFQAKKDTLNKRNIELTENNKKLSTSHTEILNENNDLKRKIDSLKIRIDRIVIKPRGYSFTISRESELDLPMYVTIFSKGGKIVYQEKTSLSSVNVKFGDDFPSGVYIVKVQIGNLVHTSQIIKSE